MFVHFDRAEQRWLKGGSWWQFQWTVDSFVMPVIFINAKMIPRGMLRLSNHSKSIFRTYGLRVFVCWPVLRILKDSTFLHFG